MSCDTYLKYHSWRHLFNFLQTFMQFGRDILCFCNNIKHSIVHIASFSQSMCFSPFTLRCCVSTINVDLIRQKLHTTIRNLCTDDTLIHVGVQ